MSMVSGRVGRRAPLLEEQGMHRLTSRTGRQHLGVIAAVALATFGLAACESSSSTAGSGGGATAAAGGTSTAGAKAPAKAASGGGSCTDAIQKAVTALVTVPVGTGVNPLPTTSSQVYACEYGIGKNAGLTTGAALQAANDDTVLVTVLNQGAADGYAQAVGDKFFPVSGVGDKAEYSFYAASGQAPDFYALKGDELCSVQINPGNPDYKELGVAAQGSAGGITPDGAATVGQKEGAICIAVFGG